jgi:hypothetical protein
MTDITLDINIVDWTVLADAEVVSALANARAEAEIYKQIRTFVYTYMNASNRKIVDYLDSTLTIIRTQDNTIEAHGTANLLNNILAYLPPVPTNPRKTIAQEDQAHQSGDSGRMSLAVRNDAGTALAGNGDYIPLTTDEDGNLRVGLSSTQRTLSTAQVTSSGTVAAGARGVSFLVRTGPVTVDGITFLAGEVYNVPAPQLEDTLPAVPYDATGGVLIISELR